MGAILFLVWTIVIGLLFHEGSTSTENKRIYNKCLIEMQDKPHKEATEFCKERVK